MTSLEALTDAIVQKLYDQEKAYRQQSFADLLAGRVEDARLGAHQAQAMLSAASLAYTAAEKFKEVEDE